MALSVRPSLSPAVPEVLLWPAPAYTALLPRPSPQLLTVSMMGAQLLPLASAQHYALHATPPLGDQSFGLVGAQYLAGPLHSTVPAQPLLLQHSTPHTAQHIIYPSPLHQVQTLAYIPAYIASTHGYADHHVTPPGDAVVDPEEHLGATQMAYVVPAPAASSPLAANPNPINDRMDVLEKALRLVQGMDHQSY